MCISEPVCIFLQCGLEKINNISELVHSTAKQITCQMSSGVAAVHLTGVTYLM